MANPVPNSKSMAIVPVATSPKAMQLLAKVPINYIRNYHIQAQQWARRCACYIYALYLYGLNQKYYPHAPLTKMGCLF
jgi:hypothetical protein